MRAVIDITGKRFGRLVVVRPDSDRVPGKFMWIVQCDCGATRSIASWDLRKSNGTKSCGCLRAEATSARMVKHGHAGDKTYTTWEAIKARCLNPRHPAYPAYGGRGIGVCAGWLAFETFLSDMGERPPGTSIDRINNDRGYEPGNCRWATSSEQASNRRSSMTSAEIQEACGRVEHGESLRSVGRRMGFAHATIKRALKVGVARNADFADATVYVASLLARDAAATACLAPAVEP